MSDINFDYKMVIGIRIDLKMTKGKTAVQAAHAAVMAVEDAKRTKLNWIKNWFNEGQKKVCVQVNTKEQLELLFQKARSNGLPCSLINDAGLTQLPPGTATAVAIGPAPNDKIDKITSNLKLL
ncbi:MAG: peptidyl-tRNA hydrolase [Asgard group archaeon]|nr:peptidyl-tRNA hydrolase [Asgard group archaeon]